VTACAAGCLIPARHLAEHDEGDTCTGCLPARVATGLLVCERCERRVREALRALSVLWDDVLDAGALKGRSGAQRGTGRPLPIDTAAAEWRTALRTCLVAWCKVLEEDFGATLDGARDTIAWMADKVAIYAGRLLASEHADQLVSDLLGSVDEDGKRHGDLWGEGKRLAFRSSSGSPQRIQCPCGLWVKAATDTVTVMECACGEWGTLDWWRQRVVGDDPAPMTLKDLTLWLALMHNVQVTERRLRSWADDGTITALVRDGLPQGGGRGVRRFDPVAVAVVAQSALMARRTA